MDEVGNREPANRVQTKGRRTAEAALVANTAIWGSTFVLVKSALAGVSPLLFLTLRFSLAAVAIGVFFRRSLGRSAAHLGNQQKPLSRNQIFAGVLVGAFLFAGFALQDGGSRIHHRLQIGFSDRHLVRDGTFSSQNRL